MLNLSNTQTTYGLLAAALAITLAEIISIASTNTHLNPTEWIAITATLATLSTTTLLATSLLNALFLSQLSTPSIQRTIHAMFMLASFSLAFWMLGFAAPFMLGYAIIPRVIWRAGVAAEHGVILGFSLVLGTICLILHTKIPRTRTTLACIQPILWALLTFIVIFNFADVLFFHHLCVFMLFLSLVRLFPQSVSKPIGSISLILALLAVFSLKFLPNNVAHTLAERTRLWFHAQYLTANLRPPNSINLNCVDTYTNHVLKTRLPTVQKIVVILIDTLREDRIHKRYKNAELTPNLNQFAQQSLHFTNAFTLFPATSDSVGQMNSAVYMDSSTQRLGKILTDNNVRLDVLTGHPRIIQAFDQHTNLIAHEIPDFDTRYDLSSPAMTATAIKHLDTTPADEPFVFLIHYFDPHTFYVKNDLVDYGRTLAARYNAEVTYTDHHVGQLLAAIPDDTAVLILSDHGEELGEHGFFNHGNRIYDESSGIVAMLKYPGITPAVRTEPVSGIDVAPTIWSLLGIEQPPEVHGLPFTDSPSDRIVLLKGDDRTGLVTQNHKIIWNERSRTLELYDRHTDPLESRNLAHKLPKNITSCDELFSTASSF